MLMVGVQVGWGRGGREMGRWVFSVGTGERLLPKLPLTFSWKHWQKELWRWRLAAYSNISQPSPKMPTLSFGDGLHLGVPCRGVLLGRVEWEEGKTSSDQFPKGPWLSWRRQSGLPEVVAATRNEGPAIAVSLRRGGDACQLPTL